MIFGKHKLVSLQSSIALALGAGVLLLIRADRAAFGQLPLQLDLATALLGAALVLGLVAANAITLQISYHTKTTLSDTLLLLSAVQFRPELCLLVVMLSQLLALVAHKRSRGLYWSDIVADSCRLGLLGFVASASYALLAPWAWELAYYGVPALLLLLGDCLTMPLVIGPLTGMRPREIIRLTFRDCLQIDGSQYLIAVPVAALAQHSPQLLPLLILPLAIVYRVLRSRYHLQDGTRALLEQIADLVDLRDPYTGGHSRRVAEYTARMLEQLNLSGHDADLITTAARIHDIGKVGIPDAILNKPGRLTDEERLNMERHPVLGANLLARYPDFARGVAIVRHHHERIDGAGYPDGLRGTTIPFGARVIAVADTWDALTSDRPYRAGMDATRAAAILRAGRGTQWAPELVDALLAALGHERAPEPRAEALASAPRPH